MPIVIEDELPVIENMTQDFNEALKRRFPILISRPLFFTEEDLPNLPTYSLKTMCEKNYQIKIPIEKIGERNRRMLDYFLEEKVQNQNEKEDVHSFFETFFASYSTIFQELAMDFKIFFSTNMCIFKIQRHTVAMDSFLQSICEIGNFTIEQVNSNPQILSQFLESMDPEIISSLLFSQENRENQENRDQENQENRENREDEVNLTDLYRRNCEYRYFNGKNNKKAIRVNEGSYWFHNDNSMYQQADHKLNLDHFAQYRISILVPNLKSQTLLNPFPKTLPHLEIVIAVTEMMSLKNALDLFDTIKNQFPNYILGIRLDETFDRNMNLHLDPSTFKFVTGERELGTETGIDHSNDEEDDDDFYHPLIYIEHPVNQSLRVDCTSLVRNTRDEIQMLMDQTKFSYTVKKTSEKYLEWKLLPSKFYSKFHLQKSITNYNLLNLIQNLFNKLRFKPNTENQTFETKSLSQIQHILECINSGQIHDNIDLLQLIETGTPVFHIENINDCVPSFSENLKKELLHDWIFVQARNFF